MSKCIHCGAEVSAEEQRKRYEELVKSGIMPMMITMCQKCRDNYDWRMESKKGGTNQ